MIRLSRGALDFRTGGMAAGFAAGHQHELDGDPENGTVFPRFPGDNPSQPKTLYGFYGPPESG
jgi:hypothetical protein